jgi:hypothetical protein
MASNVTEQPPLHSRRVEAWVYTILNPLIESLRRELLLMDKGNLSWRFYSKRCEYIRPMAEYIESSQRPNYEDFIGDKLNVGFSGKFEKHDRALDVMEESAKGFFDRLMGSNLFLKDVKDSLEKYESTISANSRYPDLNPMKEDLPKLVAEFLINRTELLPDHYMTHKFWEDYWRSFAKSMDAYKQRESFRALTKASGALKEVSEKLLLDLENHRQSLCRTYDIPAAPISIDKTHSAI